jgi:excisionase family DNA binding protein
MQSNPIAFKINEACSVARVGRTCLYDAIKNGQLRALKRGKSTLILADDLRHWLESLPVITPVNNAPGCRSTSDRMEALSPTSPDEVRPAPKPLRHSTQD